MEFNFKSNNDFLSLIKNKESQILDRTSDKIQESEGFKIVFAGLKSMLQNNAFNGFKVISISEENILKVKFEDIGDLNDLFANTDFQYNHIIELDNIMTPISFERKRFPTESNEARNFFSAMSKTGNVIFLLIKNKINYFINGNDKSESTFFSPDDIIRYNEKKEISQINDVFIAYQESIKDRLNYSNFFIGVSHLKSLRIDMSSTVDEKKFVSDYSYLLRNKPENTFRDDLKQFLTFNLRVSQVKELLLDSLKRLDIYLYDEFGEVYLIEVKWVGQSIHKDGKKPGIKYDAKDIDPKAFHQTLKYLEELDNKGQNIVRAYLVVFDARKEDSDDTGKDFDETKLTENQTKYFRKLEKFKDLRVKNFHPN